MAKRERGLPEVLFVGPPKRREEYQLVVFQVLERDVDGIPTLCRLLLDHDVVRVDGGERFITGYIMKQMTVPESDREKEDV